MIFSSCDERTPAGLRRRRRGKMLQRLERAAARLEVLDRQARIGRSHPGQKLQDAKRGERIPRIVRPAQHRQQVFDVRRLEELQAAVLHKRNPARAQAPLREYRCGLRRETAPPGACSAHVRFAPPQHLAADVLGLRGQIVAPSPGAAARRCRDRRADACGTAAAPQP